MPNGSDPSSTDLNFVRIRSAVNEPAKPKPEEGHQAEIYVAEDGSDIQLFDSNKSRYVSLQEKPGDRFLLSTEDTEAFFEYNEPLTDNKVPNRIEGNSDLNIKGLRADNRLKDHLQSYYEFEDSYKDSVGVYDGSSPSDALTFVDGKSGLGRALQFDSTSDEVTITGALPIDRDAYTIAFWFQPGSLGTQDILTYNGNSFLKINSSNKVVFEGLTGDEATLSNTSSWFHIAVSVDSDNNVNIYVNGSNQSTTGTKLITSNTVGADARINGLSGSSKIDELGIWTTNLDSNLISVLYNGGSGFKDFLNRKNFANDLNAYYAFEGDLTASVGTGLSSSGNYTFVQGKVGRAIRFDDGSTKLTGATELQNVGQSDFTLAFWLYPTDVSSNQTILNTQDGGKGILVELTNSGNIKLTTNDNNSSTMTSSGTLETNTWYYIAIRRTESKGDIFIYDSGSPISNTNPSLTLDGTIATGTDGNLTGGVGQVSADSSNGLVGNSMLDELAVYYRALPQSELNQLYNDGNGLAYKDLKQWEYLQTEAGLRMNAFQQQANVYLEYNGSLAGANEYTVSTWFRPTESDFANNTAYIAWIGDDADSSLKPKHGFIQYDQDAKEITIQSTSDNPKTVHQELKKDTWYHFVLVRDPKKSSMFLYINGRMVLEDSGLEGLESGDKLRIGGGHISGTGNTLGNDTIVGTVKADIDQTAVFRSALPQKYVDILYNHGAGVDIGTRVRKLVTDEQLQNQMSEDSASTVYHDIKAYYSFDDSITKDEVQEHDGWLTDDTKFALDPSTTKVGANSLKSQNDDNDSAFWVGNEVSGTSLPSNVQPMTVAFWYRHVNTIGSDMTIFSTSTGFIKSLTGEFSGQKAEAGSSGNKGTVDIFDAIIQDSAGAHEENTTDGIKVSSLSDGSSINWYLWASNQWRRRPEVFSVEGITLEDLEEVLLRGIQPTNNETASIVVYTELQGTNDQGDDFHSSYTYEFNLDGNNKTVTIDSNPDSSNTNADYDSDKNLRVAAISLEYTNDTGSPHNVSLEGAELKYNTGSGDQYKRIGRAKYDYVAEADTLQIQSTSNGAVKVVAEDGNGTSLSSDDNTLSKGEWFYIVFRNESGNSSLYIDGKKADSNSSSGLSGSADYTAGFPNTHVYYVDDVGVWNRTLSDRDITYLYDDTKGRNDFLLRHWSHFAVQNDIHMKSSYRITNHPHPQTADHVATKGHIDAGDHLIQDIRAYYSFEDDFDDVVHTFKGTPNDDISRSTSVYKVGTASAHVSANNGNETVDLGKALHTHKSDFSVSMWIKVSNNTTSQVLLQSNEGTLNKAWRLRLESKKLNFEVFNNMSDTSDTLNNLTVVSGKTLTDTSETVSANTWHYVTLRRQRRQVSLYVDNEQTANNNLLLDKDEDITESLPPSYLTPQNEEPSTISASSNGLQADAYVDALGVWDRALDRAEIHYLYNNGDGTERFLSKMWYLFPAQRDLNMHSYKIQNLKKPTEDSDAARLQDVRKWEQGNLDVRQTVAQGPTDTYGYASLLSVGGDRTIVDTGRRTNDLAKNLESYFTFDELDSDGNAMDLITDNSATTQGGSVTVVGMRAYYDFEVDFKDRHGSFDGTAKGASTTSGGKLGEAATFSNGDEYVDVGNAFDFGTGDFSVALWFQPKNVSSEQILLTTHTNNDMNARSTYFDIYLDGSGNLQLRTNVNSQGETASANTTTTLTNDNWYHIVATRHGDTYNLYVYDGNSTSNDISTTLDSGDISNGNTGAISAQSTGILNSGLVDELAVWTRVLTEDERSELHDFDNNAAPRYGDLRILTTGNSLLFPGDGSWTDLGSRLNFGENDFFISFWVRSDESINTGTVNLITNYNDDTESVSNGGFRVALDDAEPTFEVSDGVNTKTISAGAYSQDTWIHILVERTGKNYAMFVDGMLAGTDSHGSTVTLSSSTNQLTSRVSNTDLNGSIDELGIWTAPSTTEGRTLLTRNTLDVMLNAFYALDGDANEASGGGMSGSIGGGSGTFVSGIRGNSNSALLGDSNFETDTTAWPGDGTNASFIAWWNLSTLKQDATFAELANENSFRVVLRDKTKFQVQLYDSSNSEWNMILTTETGVAELNKWHQIAVTFGHNSSSTDVTLFVNGEQRDTHTTTSSQVSFGTDGNSKLKFFGNVDDGDILDQVVTYERVLSEYEVGLHYNNRTSLLYSELRYADDIASFPEDFAMTRPMQFMFGDGFDDGSQLNKGVQTSRLLSWSGMGTTPASTGNVRTHYLFVEYDESNGTLSTGHTTQAPTYSYNRPLQVSTGGGGQQMGGGIPSDPHWYPLDHRNRMQYYDQQNSTWKEDTLRLFVGEADVNDQGHVVATRTYAYQGRFFSRFKQGVGKSSLAFRHNLGTTRCRPTFIGKVRNPGGGSTVLQDFSSDDEIIFNGTHNAAYVTYNESNGNRAILASNGNTVGNFTPANGGQSDGDPNFNEFDFACEVVRAF